MKGHPDSLLGIHLLFSYIQTVSIILPWASVETYIGTNTAHKVFCSIDDLANAREESSTLFRHGKLQWKGSLPKCDRWSPLPCQERTRGTRFDPL